MAHSRGDHRTLSRGDRLAEEELSDEELSEELSDKEETDAPVDGVCIRQTLCMHMQ
jgi:hypothetical protein